MLPCAALLGVADQEDADVQLLYALPLWFGDDLVVEARGGTGTARPRNVAIPLREGNANRVSLSGGAAKQTRALRITTRSGDQDRRP